MVSSDNNTLQTKQLQLLLDDAKASSEELPLSDTRPLTRESRRIAPGRVRPQTGKRSVASRATSHSENDSVVSSIIGNMYTPSTTARTRSRGPSEYGKTARTRGSQRSRQSGTMTQVSGSTRASSAMSGGSRQTGASGATRLSALTLGQSVRPSTAEVLLAKKQLKMEGMIRKLLVQQQEADCTINELSEALTRLEPAERDRIDLHEMAAGVRAAKKKGETFGIQHLNGTPQSFDPKRASPWHIKSKDCDIAHAIHPEDHMTNRSNRSSRANSQLGSKGVSSLVAPGNLFKASGRWNISPSPNNNPGDILSYQDPKDKYCAPSIPKHLDSREVTKNITKWGTDESTDAWNTSDARWQTHSEDVHGYSNFNPTVGPSMTGRKTPKASRPTSAMSQSSNYTRRKNSGKMNRPASAISKPASNRFGCTDPELKEKPELWTGSGYTKEVYSRLGQQNSEKHGRPLHDAELVPPKGF